MIDEVSMLFPRRVVVRSSSRSLNFWIFPDGVDGMVSRTIRRSGMALDRHLLALQEVDDRRQVHAVARPRHHHRTGPLAQAFVRVGHDRGHGDGGVPVEQGDSISTTGMFSPPRMITSLLRPVMRM